ncbi:MAG: TIR domain-containing protein [Gammaproteobacteria bacterium]|nr:TIR domain-containing protein [Gammaproteobacteria bacterium]
MKANLQPSQHKLDRLVQAASQAQDWVIDAAITRLERSPSNYQVALSFAGEQRSYVEQVAEHLKKRGIAVFYDDFETVNLWGKNLTEVLHEIYASSSAYVVMFISKSYVEKVWPSHERNSALSRMIKEKDKEYILPVRFDNSPVPGLPDTISYLTAKDYTEAELATLIAEKIGIKPS